MSEICPGCKLSVDPLDIIEKSPKNGKEWRITRCPRERCSYNIDIAPYDRTTEQNTGSYFWNGKHWE